MGKIISKALQRILIDLYLNDKRSLNEIATDFNICKETIVTAVKKNGIRPNRYGRVVKYKDEIITKYLNGATSSELGKEYNCAANSILDLLKRSKIEIRKISYSHYKNSRFINDQGYVIVTPQGEDKKYNTRLNGGAMSEHRLIMARHLGRPLTKEEYVHHKNGIRHDNRLENLELWSKSQPPGQRVTDKLKWAEEIIETYKGIFK